MKWNIFLPALIRITLYYINFILKIILVKFIESYSFLNFKHYFRSELCKNKSNYIVQTRPI